MSSQNPPIIQTTQNSTVTIERHGKKDDFYYKAIVLDPDTRFVTVHYSVRVVTDNENKLPSESEWVSTQFSSSLTSLSEGNPASSGRLYSDGKWSHWYLTKELTKPAEEIYFVVGPQVNIGEADLQVANIKIQQFTLGKEEFVLSSANSCTKSRIGNDDSMVYKAACLFDGQADPADQKKAFRLYQEAAKNGDRRALPLLASCYMYGVGVEKNETEARILYRSFSEEALPTSSIPFPVEVRIKISNDDIINMEGIIFEKEATYLYKITNLIRELIIAAREQNNAAVVVDIEPHQNTSHLRILNVIDACFQAGIESPCFFGEGVPKRPRMRAIHHPVKKRSPRRKLPKKKLNIPNNIGIVE
jgi:hypothetical protein